MAEENTDTERQNVDLSFTTQSTTSFPDTVTVVVLAVAGVTLLLLVGLGVFCYRYVKEYWYRRNNERKMIKILKDHAEKAAENERQNVDLPSALLPTPQNVERSTGRGTEPKHITNFENPHIENAYINYGGIVDNRHIQTVPWLKVMLWSVAIPVFAVFIAEHVCNLRWRSIFPTDPIAHQEFDALQRVRHAINDRNERKCQVNVTKDFKNLNEPPHEVYPKLQSLPKFYEGNLQARKSPYQKDQSFTYGSEVGEELDYKTFLHFIVKTKISRISVIGQAGSGKSLMLKRLVRDITYNNKSLLVVFMCFTDFGASKEISTSNLIFRGIVNTSDAKIGYEWILNNQEKVVFILDGLDQASWVVNDDAELVGPDLKGSTSVIMSNILMGELFPDVKIVYSSREYAVANLAGQLRPKMVFAITGLPSADSEWLFKSFLGDDGEGLWETLQLQSHSLIPLLDIPALNIFTAIVYKKNPKNPPRCVTAVLKSLLLFYSRSSHITKREMTHAVLNGLKTLSFLGMKNGNVQFNATDVRSAGLDPEKIRDWLKGIPEQNDFSQFLLEDNFVFEFSHQIIQEFLAAQYVIDMDFISFKDVAIRYLRDNKWSVVTRFVSGLLSYNKISVERDTVSYLDLKRDTLKKILSEKYKNSSSSSLELLAAISELNSDVFIRDFVHVIHPGYRKLSDGGAYVIGSIMQHLSQLDGLYLSYGNLKSTSLHVLWNFIEHSCLNISKLDLSGNQFESEDFFTIGKFIKKGNVNELVLENCNVTNEALQKLLSASKGTTISKLDVSFNKLDDIGYATLGRVVNMHAVDELRLWNCELGNRKLKKLLQEVKETKISKLDVSFSEIDDLGYATLGRIVKMCTVDELRLLTCGLSSGKLKNLLSGLEGAKIPRLEVSFNSLDKSTTAILGDIVRQCSVQELTMLACGLNKDLLETFLSRANGAKISKLDISENVIKDEAYITLGNIVKIFEVDEIVLEFCNLGYVKIKNFLSVTKGAKIRRLVVSQNKFEKDTAAILGDLVTQCSVEELKMKKCQLTDGSLESFLSRANGAKLSKLDVSDNLLSQPALQKVRKSIFVEKLKPSGWLENSRISGSSSVILNIPQGGDESGLVIHELVKNVEVMESTKDFFEKHNNAVDVYHVNSNLRKGNVLIINNEFRGQGERERLGSEVDVLNLKQLWQSLGFNVRIKRNLSANEIRSTCWEFANDSHEFSMLILIIMSHGWKKNGEEFIAGEDWNRVSSDEIVSNFTTINCPHLEGIPKVFMFQVCRESQYDTMQGDAEIIPRRRENPDRSDMLIVYPSQSGYVSYRDKQHGTILMNAIVDVFTAHAHDQHILDLLTKVNSEVAYKVGHVQSSNQVNFLTKKLFLFPGWL